MATLCACSVALAGSSSIAAGCAAPATGDRSARDGRAAAPAGKAPDDPLFRHQWHLRAIEIPSAWAISRGEGAVVAVLDTGVAHQTSGRYRRAPDLAGTRFVAGWDFVDGDAHPDDVPPGDGRRSHGTLMAGIIAQTAGNAIGGAGIAPAATIMPIRVLAPDLDGTASAIARGLRFAADHGADVASLSIAGPSDTQAVADAVDHAVAKGVTVVAAAGNEGRASVGWPAADPKVVAVGAVTRDLVRAGYSNHGAALDIVAPAGAGDRVDTGRGPADGVLAQAVIGEPSQFCFCFSASTSAAAAQVSGVAALLVSSGSAATPGEVRAALLSGARDLGAPGKDPEYGAGLVQARRALAAAGAEPARAPSGPPAASAPPDGGAWGAWLAPAAAGIAAALLGLALAIRRRRGGVA